MELLDSFLSFAIVLLSRNTLLVRLSRRQTYWELAKLTTKGQITIPAEIRKRLNVQAGDKVVFLEENGRIFIENVEKLKFAPDEHSGGKE